MCIAARIDSGNARFSGSSVPGASRRVRGARAFTGQETSAEARGMTWEAFYLCCFLIGFALSLLSFLSGAMHLHLPHGLHGHASHGAIARGSGRGAQSPLNFGTIAAFLAWFGGTGYLLTRYSSILALLALAVAFFSGLGGAAAA